LVLYDYTRTTYYNHELLVQASLNGNYITLAFGARIGVCVCTGLFIKSTIIRVGYNQSRDLCLLYDVFVCRFGQQSYCLVGFPYFVFNAVLSDMWPTPCVELPQYVGLRWLFSKERSSRRVLQVQSVLEQAGYGGAVEYYSR